MIRDLALMINDEKQNQQFVQKFVNLLYYKQFILLHVSATYFGHLQGHECGHSPGRNL